MYGTNDILNQTLNTNLFGDGFEYSDSGVSMSDALQFNQDYISNLLSGNSELYNEALKEIEKDTPKVINEINPNVIENERLQYEKEVKEYERKKNDRKIKYKKQPVAEVRGELYREDKDNTNRNIGLALLGVAGGLGAIGLANRKALGAGMQTATDYARDSAIANTNRDRLPTGHYWIPDSSIFSPEYAKWKQKKGINTSLLSTPMTAIGEGIGRLGYDISTHGTQRYLWMMHPLDLMSKAGKQLIDPGHKLGGPGQALILGAALQPAIAASGAYNILNPKELFRPEGFKQNNPSPEDQRASTAPAEELFQRFMMGRTGRPLKFSDAKEEIPDLTPGRYKDYMRYMYQDKGLLNLGLVKATDENLKGVPEARVLGYPVTIDSVSTFAGGILGSRLGMSLVDMQNNASEPIVRPQKKTETKPRFDASVATKQGIREQMMRTAAKQEEILEGVNPKPEYEREVKKGSMKHMLGGLGGVAAGAIAGHFLGKFIEGQIKQGNDEKRRIQEIQENGYKPRGVYVTDGNNQLISL